MRPFALLLARVFLPFLVLILLRKPCRLFWISRLACAIVGRGPHRICTPRPARAGCAVMDVRATTSAASEGDDDATWQVGTRARGHVGARKAVVVAVVVVRVGRRLGREEKVLQVGNCKQGF